MSYKKEISRCCEDERKKFTESAEFFSDKSYAVVAAEESIAAFDIRNATIDNVLSFVTVGGAINIINSLPTEEIIHSFLSSNHGSEEVCNAITILIQHTSKLLSEDTIVAVCSYSRDLLFNDICQSGNCALACFNTLIMTKTVQFDELITEGIADIVWQEPDLFALELQVPFIKETLHYISVQNMGDLLKQSLELASIELEYLTHVINDIDDMAIFLLISKALTSFNEVQSEFLCQEAESIFSAILYRIASQNSSFITTEIIEVLNSITTKHQSVLKYNQEYQQILMYHVSSNADLLETTAKAYYICYNFYNELQDKCYMDNACILVSFFVTKYLTYSERKIFLYYFSWLLDNIPHEILNEHMNTEYFNDSFSLIIDTGNSLETEIIDIVLDIILKLFTFESCSIFNYYLNLPYDEICDFFDMLLDTDDQSIKDKAYYYILLITNIVSNNS